MERYNTLKSATSDLPDIFTGLIDGSSIDRYQPIQRADTRKSVYVLYDPSSVANPKFVIVPARIAMQDYSRAPQAGADTPSMAQVEFEQQKQAFMQIPLVSLVSYTGQFVASRDGTIVDSDFDLPSLTNRFFTEFGDVPVYITKIGERRRVLLRTPRPRSR